MRSPYITERQCFALQARSKVEWEENCRGGRLKNPIVSVISQEEAHVLVVPLAVTLALYCLGDN